MLLVPPHRNLIHHTLPGVNHPHIYLCVLIVFDDLNFEVPILGGHDSDLVLASQTLDHVPLLFELDTQLKVIEFVICIPHLRMQPLLNSPKLVLSDIELPLCNEGLLVS